MNKEVDSTKKGVPVWFVTFADLMTLLMCFFVLLLSFSTTDPKMFKDVSGSLVRAFGVQREEIQIDQPKGIDMISREFKALFSAEEVMEKMKSTLKMELIKGQIDIEFQDDKVVLRMNDELAFERSSATLKSSAKGVIDKLRPVFAQTPGDIIVTGHTDTSPISTPLYPSNWSLSAARAASVVEYFTSTGTIAPSRFTATGYGQYRPVDPSPEGGYKNRRVEIVFLQPAKAANFTTESVQESGKQTQEAFAPVQELSR